MGYLWFILGKWVNLGLFREIMLYWVYLGKGQLGFIWGRVNLGLFGEGVNLGSFGEGVILGVFGGWMGYLGFLWEWVILGKGQFWMYLEKGVSLCSFRD